MEEYKKKKIIELLNKVEESKLEYIYEYLKNNEEETKISKYSRKGEKIEKGTVEYLFLAKVAKYNGNIVKKIIVDENITPYKFNNFVKKYNLKEIERNMYVFNNSIIDSVFLFQKKYKSSIVSHETALYYHDLTDVIPIYKIVSFPEKYKLSQIYKTKKGLTNIEIEKRGAAVYYKYKEGETIKLVNNSNIEDEEKQIIKNNLGNDIVITTPERTIIDILKKTANVEEEVKIEAIKSYLRKGGNITRLRRMASKKNMLRILDEYLKIIS